MDLRTKLVQLRKDNGLSQLELAEKLNVSRQAVSKWEVGAAVPSMDNFRRLSELYHVPLDHLVHDCYHNDEEETIKPENSSETIDKQKDPDALKRKLVIVLGLVLLCVAVYFFASVREPKPGTGHIIDTLERSEVETSLNDDFYFDW